MKFRGAGQGKKALVAEVIVGELARYLDLRVPEMKALVLSAEIGRYEGRRGGPGPSHRQHWPEPGHRLFARVVRVRRQGLQAAARGGCPEDALTVNIDRSWRNSNLLIWHRKMWCIDHGAALYFHHNWEAASPERFAVRPFDYDDHILKDVAAKAGPGVYAAIAKQITDQVLRDVLDLVPDKWLEPAPGTEEPGGVRELYLEFLKARLAAASEWLPR